jgi:hypothetical protein
MKTLTAILEQAILSDRPTLDGWGPTHLVDAVRYRLARLAKNGSLDRVLDDEELTALQNAVGSTEPRVVICGDHPECSYLLFADGSFYLANNAQDEVWAHPRDFIQERLLADGREASDFAPESDTGKLIRHVSPKLVG